MPDQTAADSRLYALLIGADCYLPNQLPDGSSYPSLRGCVRDVDAMEQFLKRRLQVPDGQIVKLTATNTGAEQPPEPPQQWPTYANMVAAFQWVTALARPNDRVYVHYSGHGGRATTAYPQLKGTNRLDEALVPIDIGSSQARYLRDVELVYLIQAMVDKGLTVALVLDSCHAGGMVRGRGDAAVRGIDSVDSGERPTNSLVASRQALEALWFGLTEGGQRDVAVEGGGWLPEPKGYTLLAACRASEVAYEVAFAGKERNGTLTYWLLDALQDIGPGLSYKLVHDRILARIHGQYERQTPQLQGEGDRAVFGTERVAPVYAVTVMQVDEAHSRLLLEAGQAHGLGKGARFIVYAHGTTDLTDQQQRRAVAELSELGAVDSWARIVQKIGGERLEPGDQAVLLGAAATRLVRTVSLERRQDLAPAIDQQAALHAVEQALAGNGWVELAAEGQEVAYQVAVNDQAEYEIWNSTGRAIENLRPPLKIDDPAAAGGVVRRLVHLARYQALIQLRNHDELSPLAQRLDVRWLGCCDDYGPAAPFAFEPLDTSGGRPAVKAGQYAVLRIRNNAPRKLNVAVMALGADWAVTQIYPWGAGEAFVEFDPQREVTLVVRASLPEGCQTGADVLKVFATLGTTSFRWLVLPPLDEPHRRDEEICGRVPADPLEELLAAFSADRAPTRALTPAAYPSKEWVTEQVTLRIQE